MKYLLINLTNRAYNAIKSDPSNINSLNNEINKAINKGIVIPDSCDISILKDFIKRSGKKDNLVDAVLNAKSANDPLYAEYVNHIHAARQLKEEMNKKYINKKGINIWQQDKK